MQPTLRKDSIVDDIYAGALDDARWRRALTRLTHALRSSGTYLLAFNPSTGAVLRMEGFGAEDVTGTMEEYQRWDDPRTLLLAHKPAMTLLGESSIMTMREWRGTAIYNELLVPRDSAYFLGAWLHKSDIRLCSLSFQASLRRGPFDDEDRRKLQPFLAHIARALEIKDRLEASSFKADALAQSLSQAPFGLMVLDGAGRLLEANGAAERLLSGTSVMFRDKEGALRLRGKAEGELQLWIQQGRPPDSNPDGLIHVRRDGQPPISMLLSALPEATLSWLGARPRWILMVFDPAGQIQLSTEMLARDLGISRREAEVAALLAKGSDLTQVAGLLGVSIETVRTHLKTIFTKTGIHSQMELVKRVLRGPAIFG